MATQTKVIGPISAYAIAVQEGYTGSKQDWAAEIGNAQANAAAAEAAADRVQTLTESLPDDFTDTIANFAPTYSTSSTYAIGDYVIHYGSLYRCITKITTAEAWTPAHWTQVSVGEDLAKTVWYETQNLTSAQRSAARNNIQAADQMTVDFHSTQISDLETGKQDKLTFDSTPTAGSSNPVTSAGIKTVTDALAGDVDDLKSAFDNTHPVEIIATSSTDVSRLAYWIDSSGVIKTSNSSIILPVLPGSVYTLTTTFNDGTNYALLKDTVFSVNSAPNYATGYTGRVMVAKNAIAEFTAPSDARYIIIRADTDNMQNAITFREYANLNVLKNVSNCIKSGEIELNKNNLLVIKGIGSTGNKFIANTSMYIAYIPCEENATYVIEKMQDNRFAVMWTMDIPAVDVATYGYISDNTATELEITTGTGAKYLCIYYYAYGTSVNTEGALYNSLSVIYVGLTAIDRYARQHFPESYNIYVVSKDGRYSTITSAINVAPADSVILIMPGTYEEQVDTKNKNVHLIGIDKETCIILDKSGMYNTPPLEISGGSVQNLTIIETGENSTPSDPGTLPTLAYCIHADWDAMTDNSLLISNCILKCNKRATIGVGARNGFTLTIENCDIWSGVQVDTGHDPRGAFYIHTYQYASNTTGTKLIMKNNRITCEDSVVMCLQDEGGVHVSCDLENNNLYSPVGGVSNSIVKGSNNLDVTFSTTLIKEPRCYGNNVSVINA